MEQKRILTELPFKVLALAPFRPLPERDGPTAPVRVDPSSLDQALEAFGVSCTVELPRDICPDGGLTVEFRRIRDFHPDSLVQNTGYLRNLVEAREFARSSGSAGLSPQEVGNRLAAWPGIPFSVNVTPPGQPPAAASPIDAILGMVALPGRDAPGAAPDDLQTFIVRIDAILRDILARVYADRNVRSVESAWRGLQFLLRNSGPPGSGGGTVVEIVPAHPDHLEETLDRLLPALLEELPSLVVVDLPFDSSPRSLELLEKVASFGETLLAPALVWVTPRFLHLDSWDDLGKLPFIPHHLAEPPFAKWRRLRELPGSRWVSALCNRFLARDPYGPGNTVKAASFEELEPLWVGPVWGLATLIGRSLSATGWPSRFTEHQSIRLEGLPLHRRGGGDPMSTEFVLGPDRLDQFVRGGILPLVPLPGRDTAFTPMETTVSGASLGYQLLLSRVIRLLIRCREVHGEDPGAAAIEEGLRSAFALFWQRTGQPPPELQVSVRQGGAGSRAVAKIVLEPSRSVLPYGGRIELDFPW